MCVLLPEVNCLESLWICLHPDYTSCYAEYHRVNIQHWVVNIYSTTPLTHFFKCYIGIGHALMRKEPNGSFKCDKIWHISGALTPLDYNPPQMISGRTSTRCGGSLDQSHLGDLLSHFSFHPVIHNWCNKGHGILSCGMLHIKYNLLLIGKSGGSRFPPNNLWSLTICPDTYNCTECINK